jgi:hypothetical protein
VLFPCRAGTGTTQIPVPCYLGRRAESVSTAQPAARAVLARLIPFRAGQCFVLSKPGRARAGPMGTAQTYRTSHEALVANVGEEKSLCDGDVGGVLVVGGVARAFVGVPLATDMGIAALLLVVPLLLLSSPLLVIAPVIVTRNRTFSYKVTGLTTLVANLLGAGLVIFPPPLLEDLAEAFDDKRHFLVVELGGVDGCSTWCRILLLFLRRLECNRLCFGRGGTVKLVDLP